MVTIGNKKNTVKITQRNTIEHQQNTSTTYALLKTAREIPKSYMYSTTNKLSYRYGSKNIPYPDLDNATLCENLINFLKSKLVLLCKT